MGSSAIFNKTSSRRHSILYRSKNVHLRHSRARIAFAYTRVSRAYNIEKKKKWRQSNTTCSTHSYSGCMCDQYMYATPSEVISDVEYCFEYSELGGKKYGRMWKLLRDFPFLSPCIGEKIWKFYGKILRVCDCGWILCELPTPFFRADNISHERRYTSHVEAKMSSRMKNQH